MHSGIFKFIFLKGDGNEDNQLLIRFRYGSELSFNTPANFRVEDFKELISKTLEKIIREHDLGNVLNTRLSAAESREIIKNFFNEIFS